MAEEAKGEGRGGGKMAGVQNTLYVGGIPGGATEEAIMALFQSCGQVQQVRLAGCVRIPPPPPPPPPPPQKYPIAATP